MKSATPLAALCAEALGLTGVLRATCNDKLACLAWEKRVSAADAVASTEALAGRHGYSAAHVDAYATETGQAYLVFVAWVPQR